MTLVQFFRLILISIFQPMVTSGKKGFMGEDISYKNQMFYCPVIYAKDGFHISLQIHNGNYCSSENGYRQFGLTMTEVEFGFPSEEVEALKEYAESPDNLTQTVGNVPIDVVQKILNDKGGIDWGKTLDESNLKRFIPK